MMRGVPAPAVVLGLAGLIPFLYGVMLVVAGPGVLPGFGILEATPAGGVNLLRGFGAIILGFMGGCLWGFGCAPGRRPEPMVLFGSIIPAVFALFAMLTHPAVGCVWLSVGFAVLQGIDLLLHRQGITPEYWLALRLPLTCVVIACLLTGTILG